MPAKKKAPRKITLPKVPKKPGETGRKLLEIDQQEVYQLALVGTPTHEIADIIGADEATIRRRFTADLRKAQCTLKNRLRRKQLQMALEGDRTMLIWLGKQMLGQRDTPAVAIQNNVTNEAPVTKKRTKEEDEAFIQMFHKVTSEMPAPNGDMLGGRNG